MTTSSALVSPVRLIYAGAMRRRLAVLWFVIIAAACRDVPAARTDATDPVDAASDAPVDYGEDGAPTRLPCTGSFGDALADGAFGRLDGILVAIVPPGSSSGPCNADTRHVHLQVRTDGQIYDIAVNVGSDVHSTTLEHALVGPPWSEGWHTNVVVEYTALGLHADTLPLTTQPELVAAITADLAVANHVSIFATGYGPDGAHLVHRNGGGRDGLIVSHPLRASSHARAFSFTDQAF